MNRSTRNGLGRGIDMKAKWVFAALAILFFMLHKDFWLWENPSLILGIPIGLFYHICLCLGLSVVMYFVTRKYWL